MTGLLIQVAVLGVGASVLGALTSFLLRRRILSGRQMFEVRSKSGALLTTVEIGKHPSAEETAAVVEKVRLAERQLQHS